MEKNLNKLEHIQTETKRYCPLVGKEITDGYCIEYCSAVEGIMKMRNIDNYSGTREDAEKICFNCENYRE